MAKRIAVICLVAYLAFVLEFALYNFWGPWGKPELLLLVVIFFNLYLGIRFSLLAAIAGGVFKDSTGVVPFGTYILVYMAGSYITTFVRWYLYQPGSRFSRIIVTFFVVVGCFICQSIVFNMYHELNIVDAFIYLLFPQLILTIAVATYIFNLLKNVSIFFALKV